MKNRFFAPLFLGLLVSCADPEKPFENLPPPEFGPIAMKVIHSNTEPSNPHARHGNAEESSPPVQEASAVSGKIVSGQVDIDKSLAARLSAGPKILFVIAKSPQGGPPLAVKRVVVNQFPAEFSVGEQDLMTAGTSLQGQLKIIARLDGDGSAGPPQPGDLEGSVTKPVTLGTRNLRVVLNKEY